MHSSDATGHHLSRVIEGCLRDLEIKLKAVAMGNGGSREEEIRKVREFIGKLTEQSAMIEIEEVLPKIMEYLKGSKKA